MKFQIQLKCVFYCFMALFSHWSAGKYKVCSITINSANEIETFKKFLPEKDFQFIELLPHKINKKKDNSDHWFASACQIGHKCDIIVLSAHFGGTFFGESGYALPTELLEQSACQKTCGNILAHAKEIFLFGCNTLATKKKDSRTYQEYLKVLLDDGLARESAERVVASRYSPLGAPFYARMNFIFAGSHTIYGFDQLSPLGRHIVQPLSDYFYLINKEFGSYANYLKTDGYKRASNTELKTALSHTTINQAPISLANETPEQKRFFHNKCLLFSRTEDFSERMTALKDIFEAEKDGFAFFAIDHFLNQNQREIMEGRGRRIFRFIRTNKSFMERFRSYQQHLNFLPYIRIVYLSVLEKFQWIDSFNLRFFVKEALLDLIKKPDPEAYISLLLLIHDGQIQPGTFHISKADLPENYIQNIWSLLIFDVLQADAPDWQVDIFQYCEDNIDGEKALCYEALNALAHIHPELQTAQKAVPLLDSPDPGSVYYAIRLLGQSGIRDYHVHKKISDFLESEDVWIRWEAVEALGFLQTPYPDIQERMSELLPYSGPAGVEKLFWSLGKMDIQSETAQKNIIDYILSQDNPELAQMAVSSFKNTSRFSDYVLSFFYYHLEARDDIDLLLVVVESLSRNKHLRDLGIYYRFMIFQSESYQLQRAVLGKMLFLTWIHPTVQITFLNYVASQDPVVSSLAVNVLKNIENLEDETLSAIRELKDQGVEELEFFLQ